LRLSEDLRDELAAIAPESDCDRLAELSGLFHVAGSVHLRGRGVVRRPPRPRELGGRPARVQPAACVRRRVGDPHLPAAGVRSRDALPTARRGDAARVRDAASSGRARRLAPAARAAAPASGRAPLLPRCVPAWRAPRRGVTERAARPAPRDPAAPRSKARVSSSRSPRRRGPGCTCSSARGMRSPTRR